jgi:hypothetical protein
VKELLPNVEMVHYMTDSSTPQYRNKQIFSILANHDKLFPDVKASWLYFEVGHGKSPCDVVDETASTPRRHDSEGTFSYHPVN